MIAVTDLPEEFVARMKSQLGDEVDAFFESLSQPVPTSIRLNHFKGRSSFQNMSRVPWCDEGFYLVSRPFFHMDPHWHGGAYYVQEASSMIIDYILDQLSLRSDSKIWLDMCAAPGGKTGILASHMNSGDVLIANEVIPQRRTVLRENLIKGGYINTFLSGEQSSSFRKLQADVILIDAPCAGEGMMRKEAVAISQWSPQLVRDCSILQGKILDDAIAGLHDEGYILYSTCSYSHQENIENISRVIQQYPVTSIDINFPEAWSVATIQSGNAIGYQLFPHRVKGEGLFISVLRKSESEETEKPYRSKKQYSQFTKMPEWLHEFVNQVDLSILKEQDSVRFISTGAEEMANKVVTQFPRAELLAQAGIMKSKDFIPDHFLSCSELASDHFQKISVAEKIALDYLERGTNTLPPETQNGWHIIQYENTNLGWAKKSAQGWKNYFPLNWRLRSRNT